MRFVAGLPIVVWAVGCGQPRTPEAKTPSDLSDSPRPPLNESCDELARMIAPNAQRVASPGVRIVDIRLSAAPTQETTEALRCQGFIEYEKSGENGLLRLTNPVSCAQEKRGFVHCDHDSDVKWRAKTNTDPEPNESLDTRWPAASNQAEPTE